MAKFYGKVGYAILTETTPGVWRPTIVEKEYYGDVTRDIRKVEKTDDVNDDVNINNAISIVADPFAYENLFSIRYVEYLNAKWKVTNVEARYPRLQLTLGGVWNGETKS